MAAAQITQSITLLPPAPNPATDPPTEFSLKAAASVAAQRGLPDELNAFGAQANTLSVQVSAAAVLAAEAREQTAADRAATGSDRAATAADRNQTGLDRIAAQAAAQQIGTAAAFTDTNPIAKNAADPTKRLRLLLGALTAGAQRDVSVQDKDGVLALLGDIDRRAGTYIAATTNALDFGVGGYVRYAPTPGQAATITFVNFASLAAGAADSFRAVVIEGFRLGAATLTWPTINWIRPDGTLTTNIALGGFTLSTSGQDFIIMFRRAGDANIYAKAIR